MERRLSVEQDDVTIFHVSLDYVADTQIGSGHLAVAKGQRLGK